jgi:pantothenate kinase
MGADMFKDRLGLVLEREDEINCAVRGCSFLLKTITHEAFTYSTEKGPQFVSCSCKQPGCKNLCKIVAIDYATL